MTWKDTIFFHTMKEDGFLDRLRSNKIDETAYTELLSAIRQGEEEQGETTTADRLVVACLFEVPFEIENTADHYSRKKKEDGRKVSRMADEIRTAINSFLWSGLEAYYK